MIFAVGLLTSGDAGEFVSVGLEFQIDTWPFIKIAKDVVEALGMREMMLTEVQSQLLYNIDFIKCEAQF